MRDMANNIEVKRAISPQVVSDNTPVVGQIIDRAGAESLTYLIAVGTFGDADATAIVLLEEGDDANLADAAAVADADMIGGVPTSSDSPPENEAGFQFDDDNEVRKLGYIGNKRYTRLTVTPSSNSGSSPADSLNLSAVAIRGHLHSRPASQAAS